MEGIIKSALGNLSSDAKNPQEDVMDNESIKIAVVGCGGAGNNTINRILAAGVKGAELIALNTDKQHLGIVDPRAKKILIGKSITRGLGAGGYPDVGAKAAEIDRAVIERELGGAHLVFICAGMGGGTGTGSAPIVSEIARDQGAITVAMVTYPFALERVRRLKADEGIAKLRKCTNSVIIVDNNRLVELVPNLPINDAFAVADEILAKAISGLVWTITQPSLINIDFADVRSIMQDGGVGFIAVGEGKGPDRVKGASESVMKNRLLDVDFAGAKGAIIHISGGRDLTLGDAIKSGEFISERMDDHANVKWGARLLPNFDGKIEIVAIVTGVSGASIMGKNIGEERDRSAMGDIEIIG